MSELGEIFVQQLGASLFEVGFHNIARRRRALTAFISSEVGARVEYFTPLMPLSVGDPYEDGPTRNRRLKKEAEAKYRASVVERKLEKLRKKGQEIRDEDAEVPEPPPFKANGPTHRDTGIIFLSNIDKNTGDDEILRLAKVSTLKPM